MRWLEMGRILTERKKLILLRNYYYYIEREANSV